MSDVFTTTVKKKERTINSEKATILVINKKQKKTFEKKNLSK